MPASLPITPKIRRAIVLHPYPKKAEVRPAGLEHLSSLYDPDKAQEALAEAVRLARSIDLHVVHEEDIALARYTPATLIGEGVLARLKNIIFPAKDKADEPLRKGAQKPDVEVVIVNHPLSPSQQRNLEKALGTKVIDRTALILEIFGERARTHEGKLQVELAAYEYQKSRLVRSWTHLERQRGGGGFIGGPGERQLEMDRRVIAEKIKKLKSELIKVRQTREVNRNAKTRRSYPVIALVGYTNAGKSTLFNRLTGANVVARDQLFATLDPTMRAFDIPGNHQQAILVDTVGFISDLPISLVESFRATLEEIEEADLILHVRDISHPQTDFQKQNVIETLESLNINTLEAKDNRIIEVWNKIDLLDEESRVNILNKTRNDIHVVKLSATRDETFLPLYNKINALLNIHKRTFGVSVPAQNGQAIAWLYRSGDILNSDVQDDVMHFSVLIDPAAVTKFLKIFPECEAVES